MRSRQSITASSRLITVFVLAALCAALGALPRRAAAETRKYAEAKAAFKAAVAKEKRLTEEAKALIKAADEAEKRVVPTALAEALRAGADAQALKRIEADIVKTLKERSEISTTPIALDTEAKLLRKSYEEMVAGRTKHHVGLRLTTMLFQSLQKHGALEPERTTFTKIQDVRNALVAVRTKRDAAQAREAAKKDPLDQKLARLDAEHTRLMGEILEKAGRGEGVDASAIHAWFTAIGKSAAKLRELDEVRRQLLAMHLRGIREARAVPPPHLQRVYIATDYQVLYDVQWVVSPKARAHAEKTQAELRTQMQAVRSAIEGLRYDWFELASGRMPQVKRMRGDARVLEAIAREYAGAVWDNAVAAVIVDSSVAVASMLLTGGTATLVSKLPTLAEEASAAYTKRMAASGTKEVRETLYGKFGSAGRAAAQQLLRRTQAVAVKKDALIKAYVESAKHAARSEGKQAGAIAKAAEREARQLLKRIDFEKPLQEQIKHLSKLDAEAAVRLAREIDTSAAGLSVLGRKWLLDQVTGSKPLEPTSPWTAVASTVVGDALGVGSDLGLSSYRAQRQALEGLSRWKALRESARWKNLKETIKGNASSIGVTAIGTVTKSLLAAAYQERINDSSARFWNLYGALGLRYQLYKATLVADRALYAAITEARRILATLQGAYAALTAPPTRVARHDHPLVSRDLPLHVSVTFSAPLSKAPVVKLGGRTLAMQPAGGPRPGMLRERSWKARVPVGQLRAGAVKLSVALAPGTLPHAQLDTDPTTPPILLSPALDRWLHVQPGADVSHALRVNFEVHDAMARVKQLMADIATEGAKAEVHFGSGSLKTDQGWGGMSKSVSAAHTRVGATPRGDPHGHTWMRFNGLGLKSAGATRYIPSLQAFWDHLYYRQRAMATLSAAERAYLAHVVTTMQTWRQSLPRYHAMSKTWLDTIARYTLIGAMENEAERKLRHAANAKDLAKLEVDLPKVLPPILVAFPKWRRAP